MIIATYLDATRAIRLKHINRSRWKHLQKVCQFETEALIHFNAVYGDE